MTSFNDKRRLTLFKPSLGLDLGHYPLTPWHNPEYVREERFTEPSTKFYLPPKPREDMAILGQSECSFRFIVKPRTENAPLVRNQKLDIGQFKEAIMRIN